MFWGHEIKCNQGQAKPVLFEHDIKLSQAVIDPKSYKKEPVTLVVEYNKKQFILAVLDPCQSWQCSLDIMFAAGSEVKFFTRGPGTVHLTGFEMHDDLDEDFDMSMSSDEEEEEEEDELEAGGDSLKALNKLNAKTPPKVNGVKQQNGVKRDLSAKKDSAKKKPAANGRGLPVAKQADDSDEDDDSLDDEDFDLDDSDLDGLGDSDEEMDDSDESDIGEHDINDEDDDDDEDDDVDGDDDDDDEELDDEESD